MKIGSLEIELLANVARLKADMDDAKKAVGGAMKEIEQYVGYAKTALIGLGGAFSVSTFAGVVQGAIEAKAKLYELSVQTGVSVEALSGLGKVAKFSNTSLDDIAAASNKLSKALFTQNEESKGAAQALLALGINFNTFKSLSAEQQFVAVAKAMAQFEDGTAKSAAAMLLYGKAGATLLPFLKELEERGFVVGKQTTESALQAKKYEDNLITLKAAADAWKRQLAEALLPTLIAVTGGLVDGRKELDKFNLAGEVLKVTVETLAILGANVGFTFGVFGREIGAVAAQMNLLDEAAKNSRSFLDPFGSKGAFAAMSGSAYKSITEAVIADDRKARAELDDYEQRILGLGKKLLVNTAADFQRGDKDTAPAKRKRLALDDADGGAAKDTYTPLIASINQKLAAEQAEYDLARKLTEAEKFQAKVYEDIDSGVVALTLTQKLYVDGLLQRLLGTERANKATEAEAKWLEEANKENEHALELQRQRVAQLQDSVKAQEKLAEEYGLTRRELDALDSRRLRESAAQLRAKQQLDDLNPAQADMNRLLRQQADALDQIAAARDKASARQQFDSTDAMAGAGRAIKSYMDEVQRAGDAMEQTFGRGIKSMEDGLTTLFTTGRLDAKSFVDSLIAEFVRLAIVKPLISGLMGGSGGGGLGGLFGLLMSSAGGSGYGDYNTLGADSFRARGGSVLPGQTVAVGEEGVELFTAGGSGGYVTPNNRIARAGGGGVQASVNVTNHIDSRSDMAQIDALVQRRTAEAQRQLLDVLHAQGVF